MHAHMHTHTHALVSCIDTTYVHTYVRYLEDSSHGWSSALVPAGRQTKTTCSSPHDIEKKKQQLKTSADSQCSATHSPLLGRALICQVLCVTVQWIPERQLMSHMCAHCASSKNVRTYVSMSILLHVHMYSAHLCIPAITPPALMSAPPVS